MSEPHPAPLLASLHLWDDRQPARNGPWNMATDEALLTSRQTSPLPVLRLYRWDRPTLSFGYFMAEADARAALHPGESMVRRWTGGGLVHHANAFTWTLAIPHHEPFCRVPPAESYARLHRILAHVLTATGIGPVLRRGAHLSQPRRRPLRRGPRARRCVIKWPKNRRSRPAPHPQRTTAPSRHLPAGKHPARPFPPTTSHRPGRRHNGFSHPAYSPAPRPLHRSHLERPTLKTSHGTLLHHPHHLPGFPEGLKITDQLLQQKLAACIQTFPIQSAYLWEGAIQRGPETLVLIKARSADYAEIESHIRQKHPYTTPEIIMLPITAGFSPYLDWIAQVTQRHP